MGPDSPGEQRSALIRLTGMAVGALALLWPRLREDEWAEGIEEVASVYGAAAGTLASDWFEALREAALARKRRAQQPPRPGTPQSSTSLIRQPFRIEPARLPTEGLYRSIAESIRVHPETALTNAQGEMQRIVANAHRDTITDLTARDPRAVGWSRVGQGETCDFCRMLISRGAVYRKGTARFAAHTNCNCLASPAFDNVRPLEQVPTVAYVASAEKSRWSQRRKDAANKRVREYLAATADDKSAT